MSGVIHVGDCIEVMRRLPAGSVQTCVTSPPYFGLRDYGVAGQIGLEPTPDEFVASRILAGCPEGGTVLDPFMGAGTTAVVAQRLGREYVGAELNPEYAEIARERIRDAYLADHPEENDND